MEWLKRNLNRVFGFPEIVRFSWASCVRMLDELAVTVNWNEPVAEPAHPAAKKRAMPDQPKRSAPTSVNYLSVFKLRAVAAGNF